MTAHTLTRIDANDLVLFAENTGELYQTHLTLARGRAPVRSSGLNESWLNHVTGPVLTLYSKHVGPAWATTCARIQAAEELKAYYERVIAEF